MPSWHDGSESSNSYVGDLSCLDYAPNVIDDPLFCGIAVGAERCDMHKLEPRRCVAFDGTDTGRRFYMCQIENQAINCGFQSWIDKEWPDTLNNALSKLWSMYDDCSSTMMFERVERRSRELQEQKHIEALKNEVEVLKNAKEELKNVLKSQADVFRVKQNKVEAGRDALLEEKKKWEVERAVLLEEKKKWEAEKAVLKEEKKKPEYTIYEMFQASHENKVKLKKIKAICDE